MHNEINDARFSISGDDLSWLHAYGSVFPDVSGQRSSPINIPIILTAPSPISANNSLSILRSNGFPRHRDTSPAESSLRSFSVADTSLEAISIDDTESITSSTKTAMPTLSSSDKSTSTQWIYRSPKPPTSHLRPKLESTSRNSSPVSLKLPSSPKKSESKMWAFLRRSRPQPLTIETERTAMKPPPASIPPSITSIQPHVRVTSLASSESTISTASSSSRPQTPTTPDMQPLFPGEICKDTLFDPLSLGPGHLSLPSIRRSSMSSTNSTPMIGTPPLLGSSLRSGKGGMRKNSLNTMTSSSKSVTFAEEPTIHYASRNYWDYETMEEEEESSLHEQAPPVSGVMNVDQDEEQRGRSRVMGMFGRQDSLKRMRKVRAPTPDAKRVAAPVVEKPLPAKPLPAKSKSKDRRRSTDSARPSISGPLPLGAMSYSPAPSLSLPVDVPASATWTLRKKTSNESLNSNKSAGSRSIRSLRSNLSTSSRSVRHWMRDRWTS